MGSEDVLWVRFSEEDPEFNYEQLRAFTYHNCRTYDSHQLCDKYVKGQEYPIVVIEGFPRFMDRYGDGEKGTANEQKMWSFRREVYLCASRATSFLYFVFNPRGNSPEITRMKNEFSALVAAVSLPTNRQGGGAKRWSFSLQETAEKRNLEVFTESIATEVAADALSDSSTGSDNDVTPVQSGGKGFEDQLQAVDAQKLSSGTQKSDAAKEPSARLNTDATSKAKSVIRMKPPIIVKTLAKELNLPPFVLIADLMELEIYAALNHTVDTETAAKLCAKHGFTFEVQQQGTVPANPPVESPEPEKILAQVSREPIPLPCLT